jgi:hypothetical protein
VSNFIATDPITAKVGTSTVGVFDATTRDDLLHHRGDVAHLIVFLRATDVEGLVVNHVPRCFEDRNECAADILHMYQWAPWSTVTRDQYFTGSISEAHEIVYN